MSNLVYLGIDPAASKVAYVAIYENEYLLEFHKQIGKSGGEACSSATKITKAFVDKIIDKWPNHIDIEAWVESPIVGRGGVRSTMVQCYTSGAIQGALYDAGILAQSANVSSWKKRVVGKGNATKPEVADFLRLRWPSIFSEAAGNQDIIDAACIALYGQGSNVEV
jgi:Holliday junction resolvasome RuvABC endonuclease subunit